jgi:glutathione S-transferase
MRTNPNLVLCELADASAAGLESYSPFCLKAHRALKAAGLGYTRRHADRPAAYKAHNPAGQVPVLLVDGEPVFDSTAIVARVDALAGTSLTRDPEALLWEELADTALNGFLVAARWADDDNWPRVRQAYFGGAPWPVRALVAPRLRARVIDSLRARDVWRSGAEACWSRFATLLDALEAKAPGDGFWIGGALSVADLAIFAQLHSLRTALTPRQAEAVAGRRRLSRYLDAVDRATSAPAVAGKRSPEVAAASAPS